jgi:photosystem II stability/assembly factor-like uncharacterized protein
MLAPTVSCQPQEVRNEWVEAHELKGRSVHALVAMRGTVFVATDQGVFRSCDEGSTWHNTNLRVSTYALACAGNSVLLAGTESGVYRSGDYGETWALIGLKGKRVNALASSGAVIYAGTSEGIYITSDGTTWEHTELRGNVVSLAVQPDNPKVVYAGTAGSFSKKLEEFGDLYRSTDGGASWTRCWLSNATARVLFLVGFPLYYEVNTILVNPCDPREVYIGTNFLFTMMILIPVAVGDVELSADFGRSWSSIKPWPFNRTSGDQVLSMSVHTLAFGFGCEWLLVGTDDGIFLSTDKGCTWFILGPENATVRAIAVDSEGRIYAGSNGLFYCVPKIVKVSATTEHGNVSGVGWYKVGSTATITVSPTIVADGIFTNYVFKGWSVNGSIVSTSPSYTFIVNKPVTLTAVWRVEANIFTICLTVGGVLFIVLLAVIVLAIIEKELFGTESPRLPQTLEVTPLHMVPESLPGDRWPPQ